MVHSHAIGLPNSYPLTTRTKPSRFDAPFSVLSTLKYLDAFRQERDTEPYPIVWCLSEFSAWICFVYSKYLSCIQFGSLQWTGKKSPCQGSFVAGHDNLDDQAIRGARMNDTARTRKSDLYEHLKTSILTFRNLPGENLDEAQLSKTFGLSRTPLREVFRQLAGDGYIEIRANRGARVSEMSYTTLRDFFLAAPMIYGAILRLAASNASITQVDALKSSQLAFKKSLRSGSSADRAIANNRFHEITGKMAGNIYLLPSFHRLLIDHARISMTFYRPQNAAMSENVSLASEQHDQIISAIETHDEASAAQLADDHWKLSRDMIELFVMPEALSAPLGALPENSVTRPE